MKVLIALAVAATVCAPVADPPEKPEDVVTYTEWADSPFECGDEFVQITRTMTVTPHDGTPMVAYQTETRALTEEEKCDPATQEQQEEIAPVPEAESPEEILAETGVSPTLGLTIAGGLMVGGVLLTIRNRRGA